MDVCYVNYSKKDANRDHFLRRDLVRLVCDDVIGDGSIVPNWRVRRFWVESFGGTARTVSPKMDLSCTPRGVQESLRCPRSTDRCDIVLGQLECTSTDGVTSLATIFNCACFTLNSE